MTTGDLTRPIIGIENRSAAEVFDIMCDRIRRARARQAGAQEPVAWQWRVVEDGSPRTAWREPGRDDMDVWEDYARESKGRAIIEKRPLYAHPAPAQEPVAVPAGPEGHVYIEAETRRLVKRLAELHSAAGFFYEDKDYTVELQWLTDGAAPVSHAADSGESEDEMIRRILDAPTEDVIAELREQGIDPEAGVKLVDDMAAQAHAIASHTPVPQPGLEPKGCPTPGACSCPQPGGTVKVKDTLMASREFWDGLQQIRNGNWSESHFAGVIERILSALEPSPSQWNAGAEAKVREALEWYAEQVAGCRKLGNIGDPARHELDRDGGKRAREALAALPLPTPAGEV